MARQANAPPESIDGSASHPDTEKKVKSRRPASELPIRLQRTVVMEKADRVIPQQIPLSDNSDSKHGSGCFIECWIDDMWLMLAFQTHSYSQDRSPSFFHHRHNIRADRRAFTLCQRQGQHFAWLEDTY